MGLRRSLAMRRTTLHALCCIWLIAAASAACVIGAEPEPPTPTPAPDLPATVRAAVAQALAPTAAPTATPTLTPTPTPTLQTTFTPRPAPTLRSSATSPSLSPPSPSQPTFGPRPTPTPASPLSGLTNGDWVERTNPSAAAQIKALPWVADGIKQPEEAAVEELLYLADYPTVLDAVIDHPWVVDGINQLELTVVNHIHSTAYYDIDLAERIIALAWVEDGVTELENTALETLFFIADVDVGLGRQVAAMPWFADDVTVAESLVVEELWYIAYEDAAAAKRVASMPFLRSLESPDIAAMEALASLAFFNAPAFREVMSHPTFGNGIIDEWAPVVSTLYDVSEEAPAFIDVLLDPSQVTQEWRTITLPHSGAVDLVIIRTGPGARRSMDLLENAVRSAEDFMGVPLPTNYVGLLFGNTVAGYSAGTNYATHIAVLPEYDVDDGSHEAEYASHIIAHEVAHYYWYNGRDWVDEGASDFMASIAENARTGRPVAATNDPCEYTNNIAELERLTALGNDYVFDCNYSLGEGFFLDLYRTLGDQSFREGLRSL